MPFLLCCSPQNHTTSHQSGHLHDFGHIFKHARLKASVQFAFVIAFQACELSEMKSSPWSTNKVCTNCDGSRSARTSFGPQLVYERANQISHPPRNPRFAGSLQQAPIRSNDRRRYVRRTSFIYTSTLLHCHARRSLTTNGCSLGLCLVTSSAAVMGDRRVVQRRYAPKVRSGCVTCKSVSIVFE